MKKQLTILGCLLLSCLACQKEDVSTNASELPFLTDYTIFINADIGGRPFRHQQGNRASFESEKVHYGEEQPSRYVIRSSCRAGTGDPGHWTITNHETIDLRFTPNREPSAALPEFEKLETAGNFAFKSPQPGAPVAFRAHMQYFLVNLYFGSGHREVELRWDFGDGWELPLYWNTPASYRTGSHTYATPGGSKKVRLQVATPDGTVLQENDYFFNFENRSRDFSLRFNPLNSRRDSLYVGVTGMPPFTFHWDNGDTTQGIKLRGPGPDNYCVTITDGQGQTGSYCSVYFKTDEGLPSYLVYAGDKGVDGVNLEPVFEALHPTGIEIVYTAPNGKIFYSQLAAQSAQSFFEITQVEKFRKERSCFPSQCEERYIEGYMLHIRFHCRLYAPDGQSLLLENGEGLVPYYPNGHI